MQKSLYIVLSLILFTLFLSGCIPKTEILEEEKVIDPSNSSAVFDAPIPSPEEEAKKEERDRLKAKFKKAAVCEKDEDCTVLTGKCPFGCYISVNITQKKEIQEDLDNFKPECGYYCRPNDGAMCQDNKCVVVF